MVESHVSLDDDSWNRRAVKEESDKRNLVSQSKESAAQPVGGDEPRMEERDDFCSRCGAVRCD